MSGTAEVHPDATLTPSKLELLAAWLPTQPWFEGDASDLERVDAYRFVDPAGEVGIESMIVTSGGQTYHVPVTYRGEPLEDAEHRLVGTMEHSLLGTRYVYDAPADPVYVAELLRVIEEGDDAADLSTGTPHAEARGSGTVPLQNLASPTLRVARDIDVHQLSTRQAAGTLEGTWTQDGQPRTEVLAVLR